MPFLRVGALRSAAPETTNPHRVPCLYRFVIGQFSRIPSRNREPQLLHALGPEPQAGGDPVSTHLPLSQEPFPKGSWLT
jgi:hypothetical protein